MNYILKKLYILFLFNTILPYCVTFNIDLNNLNDIPDGNWVVRANGTWNNWGTGITLYDNNGDGIHTATDCTFLNDEYQFIYAITGDFDGWSNWGMTGNPPLGSSCDYNPNDSWANYGFLINNNDIELPTY